MSWLKATNCLKLCESFCLVWMSRNCVYLFIQDFSNKPLYKGFRTPDGIFLTRHHYHDNWYRLCGWFRLLPTDSTVYYIYYYMLTNCTLTVTRCNRYIPAAVQVSLRPQSQGQRIPFQHIRCCQSLTKGKGRRQKATPTKAINTARPTQETGTGHLP